jgi:chemotaxis family two-component system response regulator Rcp1
MDEVVPLPNEEPALLDKWRISRQTEAPTKHPGSPTLPSPAETIELLERKMTVSVERDRDFEVPVAPLSSQLRMTDRNGGRAVRVLLVEDNPADVRLTREVLEEGNEIALTVMPDGEEAMAFLRGEGIYEGEPRPNLVLLDLNLPKKDGREVLEELKTDSGLSRIPVVVLTTSGAETDIVRSYELHANCFITKPLDLDEYFAAVRSIRDFWLSNARLPST